MATEVWFRNPNAYIRELVEVGAYRVAWDRGVLFKSKVNPIAHAELYFGQSFPWRALAIGAQGSAEYRAGDTLHSPTAVYPTWAYGEDQELLEEMIERPVGEDEEVCNDDSVPGDELPVFGQEHRVIITSLPPSHTGPGRAFLSYLKTLQEDNPECIIHIHGLYSFRAAFGLGWGAADTDARILASKGKVTLPQGKEVLYERAQANPEWVTPLGFKPVDLAIPRVRCMFNIKSALWAGENWDKLVATPLRKTAAKVDTTSPDSQHQPIQTKAIIAPGAKAVDGDKFVCDSCSLQDQCKYFRQGAVCSVPGAEPKPLSSFFKTRDAGVIIEGLGTLVAANANRLERGMREEHVLGDLSPEVTKMIGQVFDQGTKLAKLLDPNLRGGAKVQVNVGGNGQASVIAQADTRQVVAGLIRELESRGIPRDKITPEMIQNLIAGMQSPEDLQRAIEGDRVIGGGTGRVIEQ